MEPTFSSIYIALPAVGGGLVILWAGGELLVGGAVRLARHWGMSPLLVGLTVVAFGTSMPELFVSLTATLQNHTGIMVGNVIGSNIANIGLVLALAALISPPALRFSAIATEVYLLLAASAILLVSAFLGVFPRLAGFFFVAVLVTYTVWVYRRAGKREKHGRHKSGSGTQRLSRTIIAILLGLGLLELGSNIFIKGAVDVAIYFGVSELVIGLTLAAVGTSLPEFAASLSAIRRRQGQLLVGNIIGSNLFNLLMVMGTTGALVPFAVDDQVLRRDLPVMVVFSLMLVAGVLKEQKVSRMLGGGLFFLYGLYLACLA